MAKRKQANKEQAKEQAKEQSTSGHKVSRGGSRTASKASQSKPAAATRTKPPRKPAKSAKPVPSEPSQQPSRKRRECVVVGVGASAGGLDAYKQLLQQMPDDSGVAFVLVQHLDPTHESMMVELLSKYTSMPVLQVEDATPIQPNHVYMIPPNKFIKIQDGGLFLDDLITKRGVRLPIDYFFRSLAEARQERAICVVLSGTGSDGADGFREVKAHGGMTIVQKPETAEYDGMPRAAINTGAVDFAVPIAEMPQLIIPYAHHPYVQAKSNVTLAESAPDHFRAIINLLRAYTDQDFSRYKKGTLTRRIDRRMGIRQISKPADYLKLLREDNEELRALFKDLLIGVTRFFRDTKSWENLANILTPVILDKAEDQPFRVWVPGCSSGEEAYSIAMLLFEQQQRQNRRLDLQIFATDIDSDAIDMARLGIYPENVTKDIADNLLDSCFQREGEKLRVRKKLREACIFAVQNLLSDPPFSNLDLISCRNLLIYLEPDVQGRIFDMLHFALKPNGILFLGSSESPAKRKPLFDAVSQSSRIYRKVGESNPGNAGFPVIGGKPRLGAEVRDREEGVSVPSSVGTVERSKRALLDEFAPASVVVNQRGLIQYIHGPVRNYLDFPSGEPDLELGAMAQDGLKAKTRAALQQARSSNETVSVIAPRVRRNGGQVSVRVRVHPLPPTRGNAPLFLVSFLDESASPASVGVESTAGMGEDRPAQPPTADEIAADRQLALELQATREDLQSTIEELESANEELKASNEEVMSMNEELQSTNEELETSREELQSLNEELSTVNNQLHDKVEELEATTNDLTNLLASTEMATLFLDSDLRIRRFTPATSRLMNIIESDIGRPVSDLSPRVNDPNLVADARDVLDRLMPVEREVKNGGEKWFVRRVMPFRTAENKIEGVVVTYGDITNIKQAASHIEFRERQQAVVAKLGRSALAGDDLQSLFQQTTQTVAETLGTELCKVLRLKEDRKELELIAGIGWDDGLVGEAAVPSGIDSQAGYTLQTAGPVIVKDLRKEKRFHGPQLLTDHGVVSGMSVIIGPEGEPWGVLGIHTREIVNFTIDDANFILAVANVLWEAIRRASIEGQLRDNEERTAAFLNNSAVIAWMKDEHGRHTYLSGNYQKRFQVSLDDWLGKTDHEVWPEEIADRLQQNDRVVLQSQEAQETVEEVIYPDGSPAHYLSLKFPFTDREGKRYVGGLGVDVTARVAAERALAESEERLRLAARMAQFGVYYGEVKTGEINWSPELKKIFGMSPQDPVPVSVGGVPDLVHESDRPRVAAKIKASLDPAGNGQFHDEHRIVRRDGKQRWILMQGRTVFSGKGVGRHPIRVAGVVLDITERHHFQEALEEARQKAEAANEAKSTFLANMSHEIRTPMTAILGYADVLHSRLDDPDAQSCVRTIKENGAYLCEILNDILDLSKIESGKLTVRQEVCSLVSILADIRSLMTVRATEKSLTLAIEFEGQVPETIETDSKMVRQILVNLVGNAIKFTERGGIRIVATCLAEKELVEIAVVDTGIGIDPSNLDKLFQPFEQVDNSFTRTTGGSGLGLAISKHLVSLLGGQLHVESEVDKGSTFRFSLLTGSLEGAEWISPDPSALHTIADVPPRNLPRITGRILAADDRRDIRYLIREFVESAGGQLEPLENGLQALEAFRQSRSDESSIDAVLMDIQMPVMDGLEATRKLRAEGYRGPIIALTANVMRRDRERCLEAGCDDLVSKPIDRAELVTTLATWLNRSSGEDNGNSAGLAVLCVDDNEATCKAQRILLEERGFVVQTARNSAEALQAVDDFTPNVALIDLGLPHMSGSELLAQLKSKPTLANCTFLCLSGRNAQDVPWRDLGFHGYLQKPVDIEAIVETIRNQDPR